MVRPKAPSLCFICEYFVPGHESPGGRATCKAFPDGIPAEMILEGFDHRKPYGNETVLFKKRADVPDSEVEEWERTVVDIEKRKLRGMLEQAHPGLAAE